MAVSHRIDRRFDGAEAHPRVLHPDHKIPKPFTKIRSVFGKPLFVPKSTSKSDLDKYCQQLEILMKDLMPYSNNRAKVFNKNF